MISWLLLKVIIEPKGEIISLGLQFVSFYDSFSEPEMQADKRV